VAGPLVLNVRPLLASHDYHSLQRENPAACMTTLRRPDKVAWRLYADAATIACRSNGEWHDDPTWFRQFEHKAEAERGLDHVEDLASP
jgi:Glycogen debranching enzyme N terminal